MSTESENLYDGDNKTVAMIYDNISNGDSAEESILILLQSEYIEPFEKFEILNLLAEKQNKHYKLLLKFLADNIYLLENKKAFSVLKNFVYQQVRNAGLLTDEDILSLCEYLIYLISQGFADFYPFIHHILNRHGKITTYSNTDLKIINHYSAVFAFDGYNYEYIKGVLKRTPMCSEQSFDIFNQIKSKREKAYSQYAKSLLYIMRKAFNGHRPDYEKFNEMLSAIPMRYREELYVDSLLRNSERLYANLFKFYKNGGHKNIYTLSVD